METGQKKLLFCLFYFDECEGLNMKLAGQRKTTFIHMKMRQFYKAHSFFPGHGSAFLLGCKFV